MKIQKLIALLVVLMVVLAAVIIPITARSESTVGDIDGDGKVSVSDVISLRKMIMTGGSFSSEEISVADINNDGVITVSDVVALRTLIMGGTSGLDSSDESSSAISSDTDENTGDDTSNTGDSISEDDLSFSNRDLDASFDESSATLITLNGNSITASGDGAVVDGTNVVISQKGTYIITGTLSDGQILVAADDEDKVQIVLKNADITCSDNSPFIVQSGDKVFVTLADGSVNRLCDGAEYSTDTTTEESSVDGVLFSKSDLTINGIGSLNITANYKHAIVSKDDLVVTGGTITVQAVGGGLYGKDCVKIADGTFDLTTGSDGIQSDNTEDTSKGYIYIENGDFTINAGNDGIQAETLLKVVGGDFDITTGGGSSKMVSSDASAKGLKCTGDIAVTGGTFTLDTADDSVHANANISITGGDITAASGDDGIHADTSIVIDNGTIDVTKSYEGIESNAITINGGNITVVASDDGLNAAGGNDSSSMGGRPGENTFTVDSSIYIKITGGTLNINASGDGIDANGNVFVSGGETYVSGPTDNGNAAFDYDGTAEVTGGILVAAGSSGMAQNFSTATGQCAILYNFTSTISGGSAFSISDSQGNVLVSFTPPKNYQSVTVTAPNLSEGSTYTLTAGSQSVEVTLSSTLYSNGGSTGGSGGGPGGGGTPPMG